MAAGPAAVTDADADASGAAAGRRERRGRRRRWADRGPAHRGRLAGQGRRDRREVTRARARRLAGARLQLGRRDLRSGHELAQRAEAAEAARADEHDDERGDDRHRHEGRGRPGLEELAQPCADKVHEPMIGARDDTGRRSIAGTLQLALLGLTIVLAIIGAIGIGALYEARQDYENEVAEASALEVASANLLAATVALEANLARPRSRRAARFVAAAARSFDDVAERVGGLADDDDRSHALAAPVAPARRTAAALAMRPTIDDTRARATRHLRAVRDAVQRLATRQGVRREDARDRATDRSRAALLAIVFGAGLALVGVLAFLTLLIRNMRRPLDDLVGATRRMSSGDLGARVEAGGPKELEAVGLAFNAMGADLATARERVEAQRQRLATTIQSLGDGLVICDNIDRVTSLNPRAIELVPGLRVGSLAHGRGSPLPELADALAREVEVRREGDLTLAVTAARLAGSEGGVAWTLRDITERARLEQAKSDFVATASHELRSPLTSIKGFIELLETTDNENLTERQREFIRIALQSTDRLVELVNDLLDIARIEAGQFEIHPRSVDLRDTVEEVAALMAPRMEAKRQRLDVQVHDPRPAALADPARVRQIVTNLVTNAHLYTPEDGSVTLRLAGDAQGTTITVADSGPGIAPEEVRRLFDRFFRGSSDGRKSPGTGLGLAIVKSLVDLHGGSVDVQSTLGRGTTFTVRLPAAPGGAMTVARPTAAATPAALGSRRVLIVDDEPALAALIAQQLQPLGLRPCRSTPASTRSRGCATSTSTRSRSTSSCRG